jgi:peptidyl-prolyl cis-trans isomerase D
MATLQKIRDKFGIIVSGLIGLSLLSFIVLTGQNKPFFGVNKRFEIARVAGHPISIQDYERRINDLTEIYKLSGNNNIDEETAKNIRNQVWEDMVRETILAPEFKRLGLDVSSDEMFDLVQGDNPHPFVRQLFSDPNTGMLDRSALIGFLQNMENDPTGQQKTYWLFMEKQIYNERRITKYLNLIRQGLYVTDFQAEQNYLADNRKADLRFVMQRFDQVPDSSVTVTRADLEKYYKAHEEDYTQKASRSIEYVTFDVVPSAADKKDADEWIHRITEEFSEATDMQQFINMNSDIPYVDRHYAKGELPDTLGMILFNAPVGTIVGPYRDGDNYKVAKLGAIDYLPDSVHVRHILISPNQNRTDKQAKEIADSLKNLISQGVDFGLLAMQNSDDKGSAQLGGDLGWFKEGVMVQPFNDVSFNSKKGDIVIVKTRFGYHIIDILGQSPRVKKLKVGILDRKIEPSSTTYQQIYSEASKFAGNNNTYQKFNAAIESEGLDKHVANNIGINDDNIPGLDDARVLVRSIYNTKKGDIVLDASNQAVFEIDDRFIVAYVTDVKEEGIAPLSDVETDVRLNVMKEKKADILQQKLAGDIKSAGNLDDLATKLGVRVQEADGISFNTFAVPAAGIEPAINAAAFVLPENKVSQPIKGTNGVYVVQVTSITQPAQTDNYTSERSSMIAAYQTRTNVEAYESLRESAHIKDERYKFY